MDIFGTGTALLRLLIGRGEYFIFARAEEALIEARYFKQFDCWLWHCGFTGESGISKLIIPSTLSRC